MITTMEGVKLKTELVERQRNEGCGKSAARKRKELLLGAKTKEKENYTRMERNREGWSWKAWKKARDMERGAERETKLLLDARKGYK